METKPASSHKYDKMSEKYSSLGPHHHSWEVVAKDEHPARSSQQLTESGRGTPGQPHDWEDWSPDIPLSLDEYFQRKMTGTDQNIKEIYKFEINRLDSFKGWPKSAAAYPTKLAKCGFYYTGTSDIVACYICLVQIGQWERADAPWKEHKKRSPQCPIVLGTDKSNVPLLSAGSESSACAATNDRAEREDILQDAREVFDFTDDPKEEAIAKFKQLLEKYPYTSLNTDKVKPIVDRFKEKTQEQQANAQLDLPKDVAVMEFQSLLEKYPYSSLNTEKIQRIVGNFKQNVTEVQKTAHRNPHQTPKNGFKHDNTHTNNTVKGQAKQSSPRRNSPSANTAGVTSTRDASAKAKAGRASSQPIGLRVDDNNTTLQREGHATASILSQRRDEHVATTGPDGQNTIRSDAVPFAPGNAATYNPLTAPSPPLAGNNNDISIMSEVLVELVAIPVLQGLHEHCPKADLSVLAQSPSAQYPRYAHINKRVESFTAWSHGHIQDKRALAEAGFFYTGQDDRVRCWFCNGGLCNWEREDIPWYEHERWFGRCRYLLKCSEKSPVVKATIETAKHINAALVPQTHCHHHGHIRHGRTQCDKEQAPQEIVIPQPHCHQHEHTRHEQTQHNAEQAPQLCNMWSMKAAEKALEMGYSKGRIQVVVNSKGYNILKSTEELIEALLGSEPEPEPASLVVPSSQGHVKDSKPAIHSTSAAAVHKKEYITGFEDVQTLQRENEELRSANLCRVCLTKQISLLFLPCSHLICCVECGMRLEKCPHCRQHIQATSKVYL